MEISARIFFTSRGGEDWGRGGGGGASSKENAEDGMARGGNGKGNVHRGKANEDGKGDYGGLRRMRRGAEL